MRSEQLTDDQLSALAAKLRPMLAYLGKLEKRMEQTGFAEGDRLLVVVREARKAMLDTCTEVHYLSCDGVGRPPRKYAWHRSAPNARTMALGSGTAVTDLMAMRDFDFREEFLGLAVRRFVVLTTCGDDCRKTNDF